MKAARPSVVFACLLVTLMPARLSRGQDVVMSIFHPVDGSYLHGPLASLGDVDGDGVFDFVTGKRYSPDILPLTVLLEVRSGATGSVLWSIGRTNPHESFGICSGGADLDGDSIDDLIVGAPGSPPFVTPDPIGDVSVYSGRTGVLLRTIVAASADDDLGSSVAGIRDVNGDGTDDIIAGAPNEDTIHGVRTGAVHVYSGATGLEIYMIPGADPYSRFGRTVSVVGDCDGDSIPEFAVGSHLESSSVVSFAGAVTLYSGATGLKLLNIVGLAPNDQFGTVVAGVGDIDSNGVPDIGFTCERFNGAGSAPVVIASGFDGSILNQPSGLVTGGAISSAGDVDQDGFADWAAVSGEGPGTIRTISGHTGMILWAASGNGNTIGALQGDICNTGDLNGDGISDLGASTAGGGTLVPYSAVRIFTGTCGSTEVFGTGCPTSNGGMPTLTAIGSTCLTPLGHGVTMRVDPTINPVAAPFGIVLISPQEVSIPLPGGCTLVANPTQSILVTVPFILGGFPYGLALGPVPPGVPLGIYAAQAFRLDSGLARGYCATNGLRLEVK